MKSWTERTSPLTMQSFRIWKYIASYSLSLVSYNQRLIYHTANQNKANINMWQIPYIHYLNEKTWTT